MKPIFAAVVLSIAATPALAHLDPGQHGSFAAGLSHPVFGLDHILAMLAVGLWAAVLGGRAIWVLPLSFVGVMTVGFTGAVLGYPLLFVEPMVLFSVLALGLALALSLRLPVSAAAGIVGVSALFHGHAHGGELGSAGAIAFGAGLAVSTFILHSVGIGIAMAAGRAIAGSRILQGLGWVTALGGLWVIVGN